MDGQGAAAGVLATSGSRTDNKEKAGISRRESNQAGRQVGRSAGWCVSGGVLLLPGDAGCCAHGGLID